ncbi:MAG: hypothetical protein R2795_20100 [Saprospiraceae bacterium]
MRQSQQGLAPWPNTLMGSVISKNGTEGSEVVCSALMYRPVGMLLVLS